MAAVLDAFVGVLIEKVADLAVANIGQVLGVKNELNTLQSNMKWIERAIQGAGRKMDRDGLGKLYVDELTDWMYDAEDIIELCRIHGSKLLEDRYAPSSSVVVCNPSLIFSCFGSVPFRHKIASKIIDVNVRFDRITRNKNLFHDERSKLDNLPSRVIDRETSPLITLDDSIGFEIKNDTKELVDIITKDNKEKIMVVAICGMAGIGKSTLAKKLYNDPQVVKTFEKKAWVFVSPNCTNVDVLKKTIENTNGHKPESENKANLQEILVSIIEGKSFFLVLDDVWNENAWQNALKAPLDRAARGTILVTTRYLSVAARMRAYIKSVEPLSVNSGWELLCKCAYLTEEDDVECLRDIGTKIVDKCKGLPLAIKVIGGVLLGKERTLREWEMVLNSDTWTKRREFEGPLLLSYEDLSPQLQQCFLYCSLLPKGKIPRPDLVRFWVAEGFIQAQGDMLMEERAEEYYYELIKRNLLQSDSTVIYPPLCTIHDLLRSLAQSLSEGQSFCCDAQKLLNTNISKVRRLSIVGDYENIVTIPNPNDDKLRLRTLLLFNGFQKVEFHLFERLEFLRVLHLNEKGVEIVPESLEKLKFLRMLDLDRTNIKNLPESICSLINLQILNLQDCKFLMILPTGLTKLSNLRRLGISGTPLKWVPKGIGGLKLLNDLEGFVVANSSSREQENDGWDLKELEPLTTLRCLRIEKLEKSHVCDVQVLKGKPHLIELELYCTPLDERKNENLFLEEELNNVEKIFQNMSPSSCLEKLHMRFFGRQYPKWIEDLSHLTLLRLEDCINAPVLPPLGQLPKLEYLFINNACGVATIGSEFLGNGAVAFPKLEYLEIETMPNWEIWSLETERIEQRDIAQEGAVGTSHPLSFFPRLKNLVVRDCPKLSALPEELNEAINLQVFIIKGAQSLKAVQNLRVTSRLWVDKCPSLEKLSNLPQLKQLEISECPTLRWIENIDCLQLLFLDDYDMESLPHWLSEIPNRQQNLDDTNTELILYCRTDLFRRCLEGREYWPIIQQFSSASIKCLHKDIRFFIEYNKVKQTYKTNYVDH